MTDTNPSKSSPRWGSTTKMVVAFTFIALLAALLIRVHTIIVPLLLAFIFSYLLYPVACLLDRLAILSWRASVGIVYIVIVLLLLGLITLGGVGVVNQVQSLITFVQSSLDELPTLIENVAAWLSSFGLDISSVDLTTVSDQLLSVGRNLLGQMGSFLGSLAGSAASFLGWTLFVLLVSFFVLAESDGLREGILKVDLPGYTEDLRRLGQELGRIWNAFLRGQIIIFLMALIIYSILLPALSVRYAIGIAFMAALAKFLPYVGPAITWVIMALVTYFQPSIPFGLEPLPYMLIVVITTSIIDWFMDNFIVPRIMARTLKVHPAAVLVAALVAANLLGLLGVIIAAPFLATCLLLGRYIMRKMLDLNPWPVTEPEPPSPGIGEMIRNLIQFWRSRFNKKKTITTKDDQGETE